MNIVLAYIAVSKGPITQDYCARFVASYHAFRPLAKHRTVIVCNGGPLPRAVEVMFSGMSPEYHVRNNDPGWDVAAYIDLARNGCAKDDMLLCLGESNYFHREGWLKRLAEAWEKHGAGVYGPYATNVLRTHILSTAFACPPSLLAKYPRPVTNRSERYEFEHGEKAFWRWAWKAGHPAMLVTWDGEWTPERFRHPNNIMWRGDQGNLLMFCNHTDRYFRANAVRKMNWSKSADRPFK